LSTANPHLAQHFQLIQRPLLVNNPVGSQSHLQMNPNLIRNINLIPTIHHQHISNDANKSNDLITNMLQMRSIQQQQAFIFQPPSSSSSSSGSQSTLPQSPHIIHNSLIYLQQPQQPPAQFELAQVNINKLSPPVSSTTVGELLTEETAKQQLNNNNNNNLKPLMAMNFESNKIISDGAVPSEKLLNNEIPMANDDNNYSKRNHKFNNHGQFNSNKNYSQNRRHADFKHSYVSNNNDKSDFNNENPNSDYRRNKWLNNRSHFSNRKDERTTSSRFNDNGLVNNDELSLNAKLLASIPSPHPLTHSSTSFNDDAKIELNEFQNEKL
jgi:hypothetical protein